MLIGRKYRLYSTKEQKTLKLNDSVELFNGVKGIIEELVFPNFQLSSTPVIYHVMDIKTINGFEIDNLQNEIIFL